MQYVQNSRNTRTSFFFIKDLPFSYHATKIIWVNYSKNKWERLYRSEDIRAVLTASCTKWWRCSRQLSVLFRLRNGWPGPRVPGREKTIRAGIWQRPATDLTVDLLRAFCLRVLGEAYAWMWYSAFAVLAKKSGSSLKYSRTMRRCSSNVEYKDTTG